jgi:RNA polymerase sigma factor (sigma-70 family)
VDDATGIETRLLAGDPDALGEVVRWIAQVIASRRYLALRHEWIDLHQEALMRVIESLRQGRFDPGQDFRRYVQAIARYTTLQSLNRPERRFAGRAAQSAVADPDPGPEERLSLRDLARRALARASQECRQLLRAYFIEELDYEEIARRSGVPSGTVKSRLMRCLESAHRALTGRRTGRFPKTPAPAEGDA